MRDQKGRGETELGEREQEKFTGEWVDATRPSNRRLDYSARHIGRVYVCECARARARVYVRFSSCILLLGPEYRLSLSHFILSPSSLYRSPSCFSSFRSVPEEQIAVPGSRVDRVCKRVSDG